MRPILIALAIAVPSTAHTATTSLKCSVANSTSVFELTLDEAHGTAIFANQVVTREVKALFTPDQVTIQFYSNSAGDIFFRVNRVTMAVERIAIEPLKPPQIETGNCDIYTPSKRAF